MTGWAGLLIDELLKDRTVAVTHRRRVFFQVHPREAFTDAFKRQVELAEGDFQIGNAVQKLLPALGAVRLERLVVVEQSRFGVRLPDPAADLELWVQYRAVVQGFRLVQQPPQIELHGLADAFALEAHPLRVVEPEREGGPGIRLPDPRE